MSKLNAIMQRLDALEKVVSSNSILLTDPSNPNYQINISLLNGNYNVDKVITTTEVEKENITNQQF